MLIDSAPQADALDWEKSFGLIPVTVQDAFDGRVLMQAWMNRAALEATLASRRLTFWSRSRQALWVKGETSGNALNLESLHADCDGDSLLALARPSGPACHRGSDSCFDEDAPVLPQLAFLALLERRIVERDRERPEGSYTAALLQQGTRRVAQKVGEEGVETALAALGGSEDEVCDEAADLLYHLLVLLRARGLTLGRVLSRLKSRGG